MHEDVAIYNMDDVLFALSIHTDGINNVASFNGTRGEGRVKPADFVD